MMTVLDLVTFFLPNNNYATSDVIRLHCRKFISHTTQALGLQYICKRLVAASIPAAHVSGIIVTVSIFG